MGLFRKLLSLAAKTSLFILLGLVLLFGCGAPGGTYTSCSTPSNSAFYLFNFFSGSCIMTFAAFIFLTVIIGFATLCLIKKGRKKDMRGNK